MPREIQINVPTYNKIKAAPAPPRLPNSSETSTKCSEINLAVTEADQKHSADRRNAYFSFVSPTNNADSDKSFSPSPQTPWHAQSPMSLVDQVVLTQQQSTSLATNTVTTVSAALTTTTTTTTSAMTVVSQRSSPTPAQTEISAPAQSKQRSSAQVDLLNPTTRTLTQTGIDRYIQVKRKLSPQQQKIANPSKIAKTKTTGINTLLGNKFAILDNECDKEPNQVSKAKPKPPPIYLREQNCSELVNKLTQLIGDNT
ncbi:uncharacterized protein LOC118732321 [Rhagoletis pomonella]|uniref:uncharacterized protein LOC118732321 n=1 Tax=Rhagoletis pomonella TaxID=28610 RepID=UPI00177DFA07|nr:uncharacterized protein LOC118732321 [Rhagoletis pomonella]